MSSLLLSGISSLQELGSPVIVSGPCSAESRAQVLTTAKQLKDAGIKIFRAGLWKPRTFPGSFQGVGEAGLEWLAEVKRETDMLIATEVATPVHVQLALEAGVDILWIGARTVANPFAVQEIATILEGHTGVCVMVKNPVNPDIDLWIGALQRLYNSGVRRLAAIHRGFSTYGRYIYRNSPQWNIPIELHRQIPHLPLLCDPSHIGGKREFIPTLSQWALDMGFNGLFIESHCNPNEALSDKEQQVTPEVLKKILNKLIIRDKSQTSTELHLLRERINQCDADLLEVLSRRMSVSREIGVFKKEHHLQVVQTSRYDTILKSMISQASKLDMSEDFIKKIMSAVHEESVRQQIHILNNGENSK